MIILEYKTISFDPFNHLDGQWHDTTLLDEKLNKLADEKWVVQLQWTRDDIWFFLLIREQESI